MQTKAQEERASRTTLVRAVVGATLVGTAAGLAVGGDPAAGPAAIVGCVIGLSAGLFQAMGLARGVSQVGLLAASTIVTALEGLVASAVSLRGDDELMDALLGRTLMATLLGLICFFAAYLLSDTEQDG